jgi:hypothetical protein
MDYGYIGYSWISNGGVIFGNLQQANGKRIAHYGRFFATPRRFSAVRKRYPIIDLIHKRLQIEDL